MDELLGDDGLLLTPTLASAGYLADGRCATDTDVTRVAPRGLFDRRAKRHGPPRTHVPLRHVAHRATVCLQVRPRTMTNYLLLDGRRFVEAAYPWARSAPGYESLATVSAS